MTSSARIRTVRQRMHEIDPEPSHAMQVCDLVLQLFDQLGEVHGLGGAERELLEAAALLHDIGWSIGAKGHHKSALKLILEIDLPGFKAQERQIIANIARYHRKAHPHHDHAHFARLSQKQQRTVRVLASLLRIADGLDRSHLNAVERISCRVEADQVGLSLKCRTDCGAELYGFERKKELFTETLGLGIFIEGIEPA